MWWLLTASGEDCCGDSRGRVLVRLGPALKLSEHPLRAILMVAFSPVCSSRIGVVQTPQHCAPVYMRAVRSGKERPDKSHSQEKPTSLGYKSHWVVRSTAAKEALAVASNGHLSLHQPALHP